MTADQEKLLRNIEETRAGLGLAPPQTASHPSLPALTYCPFCGHGAIWCERKVTRFLFAHTTNRHEWQAACSNGCARTHWNDSREFMAETWNRRVGTP